MGIDMKFVLFSDRHMPHLRFTSAPHGRGEALLLMKGAETKKNRHGTDALCRSTYFRGNPRY